MVPFLLVFLACTQPSPGLDPARIEQLIADADRTLTDALLVVADGEVVVERYAVDESVRLPLQSITKPVAALAIAFLVEDGRIESLDVPMGRWFPSLASGITLRHVLTHTSGLDPGAVGDLEGVDDLLGWALAAEPLYGPGERWSYDGRAFQLVEAVVRAEAGCTIDELLADRLFAPLGITDVRWHADATGRTRVHAGLELRPADLARLGQALADGGRGVVPAGWIAEMARPQVEAQPRQAVVWQLRDPHDPALGYGHSGAQGQYLLVYPDARLVVVRFATPVEEPPQRQAFHRIRKLADDLARARLATR